MHLVVVTLLTPQYDFAGCYRLSMHTQDLSTDLPDLPAMPTIQQSAAYLNVSDKFIRRRIAEGKLRAWRIGRRAIRMDPHWHPDPRTR